MLTKLLLLPLAPVRGVAWVADQLLDVAEEQLAAQHRAEIQEQLAGERDAFEAGQVSEDEYRAHEEALLDRLFELRAGAAEEDTWIPE